MQLQIGKLNSKRERGMFTMFVMKSFKLIRKFGGLLAEERDFLPGVRTRNIQRFIIFP